MKTKNINMGIEDEKKFFNTQDEYKDIVEKEKVITDIYDTGKGKVELLESLDSTSPIKKFIEKRGTGIHHVCFEVDDIKRAIIELKENNIRVLSDEPRTGAEGYQVVFIHPSSTGGVLVELAQKPH